MSICAPPVRRLIRRRIRQRGELSDDLDRPQRAGGQGLRPRAAQIVATSAGVATAGGTRVPPHTAVVPQKIVGSVGRCRDFDRSFMPLRASVGERWKRVDLAFHRNVDLPPVSLYKLGDAYFVEDGNHRVSVARYHGVPGVEAYVTEFWPARVESQDAE